MGECRTDAHNEDGDQTKLPKGANMAQVVDSNPSDKGPSTPMHTLNDNLSDQGAFECHCCVDQEEIISQHTWDSMSFSAEQVQPEQNFVFDKSFVSPCQDAHSLGNSDITMKHMWTLPRV